MLRLLLEIALAWISLSLTCGFLWVLLVELARLSRKAHQAPTRVGTSRQADLSEVEVEVLLSTPESTDRKKLSDDSERGRTLTR